MLLQCWLELTRPSQDVSAPRDVSDDAPIAEAVVDTPPASQESSQEVTPVDQGGKDAGNQEGNDAAK